MGTCGPSCLDKMEKEMFEIIAQQKTAEDMAWGDPILSLFLKRKVYSKKFLKGLCLFVFY